jgi:hypothetical protein
VPLKCIATDSTQEKVTCVTIFKSRINIVRLKAFIFLSQYTDCSQPEAPMPKRNRYNAEVEQEPEYKPGDVLVTIVAEGQRSVHSRCWRTWRR